MAMGFNPLLGFYMKGPDSFNYYKIPLGCSKCVPINTEMFVTDDLELIGDLTIEGRLTIWDIDDILKPHIVTTTSDLTLTNGHDIILCDGSSNTITITLPAAASSIEKVYSIKAIDTTYSITVDANASETIDGSLTKTILLYSTLKIVSNGTGWHII